MPTSKKIIPQIAETDEGKVALLSFPVAKGEEEGTVKAAVLARIPFEILPECIDHLIDLDQEHNDSWQELKLAESSNIEKVIWHRPTATMRVYFKNGGVYEYYRIRVAMVEEWQAWTEAGGSTGKWFREFITSKPEEVPCRKMGTA